MGADTALGLIVTRVMPDPYNTTLLLIKELHANFRKYGPPKVVVNQTVVEGYLAAKTLVETPGGTGADAEKAQGDTGSHATF